jgi:hypothetical protein
LRMNLEYIERLDFAPVSCILICTICH